MNLTPNILLSYPKSGSTLIRYCLEFLTQKPTSGWDTVLIPVRRHGGTEEAILLRPHEVSFGYDRSHNLAVLLRNPLELVLRPWDNPTAALNLLLARPYGEGARLVPPNPKHGGKHTAFENCRILGEEAREEVKDLIIELQKTPFSQQPTALKNKVIRYFATFLCREYNSFLSLYESHTGPKTIIYYEDLLESFLPVKKLVTEVYEVKLANNLEEFLAAESHHRARCLQLTSGTNLAKSDSKSPIFYQKNSHPDLLHDLNQIIREELEELSPYVGRYLPNK
tara:strand:+ start:1984 stop:2826 length:843 start_codon:yes stop_codon:yes gene_type:complete